MPLRTTVGDASVPVECLIVKRRSLEQLAGVVMQVIY